MDRSGAVYNRRDTIARSRRKAGAKARREWRGVSGVGRRVERGALKDLFRFCQVFWGDSPARFNGSTVNALKEFGRFIAFWQVLSCFWGGPPLFSQRLAGECAEGCCQVWTGFVKFFGAPGSSCRRLRGGLSAMRGRRRGCDVVQACTGCPCMEIGFA